MRSFAVLALTACLVSAKSRRVSNETPCRIKPEVMPENKVHAPLEHVNDLPSQWLWNDVNGINYLTTVKQQHIP